MSIPIDSLDPDPGEICLGAWEGKRMAEIRAAFSGRCALGLEVPHLFRPEQDGTAVSHLQFTGRSRRVLLLNDTSHRNDGPRRDVLADAAEAADPAS